MCLSKYCARYIKKSAFFFFFLKPSSAQWGDPAEGGGGDEDDSKITPLPYPMLVIYLYLLRYN